jgi:hypothetical protein
VKDLKSNVYTKEIQFIENDKVVIDNQEYVPISVLNKLKCCGNCEYMEIVEDSPSDRECLITKMLCRRGEYCGNWELLKNIEEYL